MYNLSLHIEYLLLRHDCVVLPGIGAFINVRHAARLDEESGKWYPMSREVRFNRAVVHDDGLLATSYSRKKEIEFGEGRELLRKDLTRLEETLYADGEVTMGHLGILRLEEGVLRFIPQYSSTHWSSMLGYLPAPAYYPQKIERNLHEERESESVSEETFRKSHKSVNSKKFDTKRNYYIAVNKVFARAAACFLIVAAIALSLLIPGTYHHNIDKASVIPVETIINESIERLGHKDIKNRTQESESHSPQATEKKVDLPNTGKQYHIIVGTFRTEKEARTFVENNSHKSYTLRILGSPTYYRVTAASSGNMGEMQQLMMSEDFKSNYSQAWIWTEDPDSGH